MRFAVQFRRVMLCAVVVTGLIAQIARGDMLIAEPAPAQPAAADDAVVEQQRARRDRLHDSFADHLDSEPIALSSLVTVNIDPASQMPEMRLHHDGERQYATVKGSKDSLLVISASSFANAGAKIIVRSRNQQVVRYNFGVNEKDDIWHCILSVRNGAAQITGYNFTGYGTLRMQNGQMTLTVRNRAGGVARKASQHDAATLREFIEHHPREYHAWVRPMLSQFSDLSFLRPGAGDVYPIFTQIEPDPAITKKIKDLLPRLDADAYADREKASRALESLGAPGVLAALRMDKTGLSPEQTARLNALCGSSRTRPATNAETALNDPQFLIDCLDFEDQRVRELAKAQLEKVLKRPVQFDVSLEGEKRIAAANAVRESLLPPADAPPEAERPDAPAVDRPM